MPGSSLEQEIAKMEQDLASKRVELEEQQKSGEISKLPPEKEILHEIVGERMEMAKTPSEPLAPQSAPSEGQEQAPTVEPPSYLSGELKDSIQSLVNMAFGESIDKAIKTARLSNNAALIDAFHDALVDELYDYLVERGKLKKV